MKWNFLKCHDHKMIENTFFFFLFDQSKFKYDQYLIFNQINELHLNVCFQFQDIFRFTFLSIELF